MESNQVHDNAAVIPTLTCPGVPIEVWVEVDGIQVPYYSREHDENKKEVTCWIESEAGKSFAIAYKPKTEDYSMGIKLYLDGTKAAYYIILPIDAHQITSISDIQVSQEETRDLIFGTLELTDDDAYLKQRSRVQDSFGEIRVVINQFESFRKLSHSEKYKGSAFSLPETTKIHERAKKGLTHLIKQGKTRQHKAPPVSYDIEPGPVLATFVFRYRPRAMLQANGVMAPDPTQSSSSTQDEDQSPSNDREGSSQQESEDEKNAAEDQEEERALLARLEEIRKKRKLAEETGTSGNRRKRVKIERVAPTLNFTPGEIVDAADDIRVIVPESKSEKPKIVIDLTL